MWKLFNGHTFVLYRSITNSQSPIQKQVSRVISASSSTNNTKNLKPWTEIPGPKSYPVIGPLFSFLPRGELYNLGIDLLSTLHSTYGPIARVDKILNKKPLIFLCDAESTAQILRGENQMPIRPGLESIVHYRTKKKNVPPGSPIGLLGVHGESWQKFRSTVNQVLLQPRTIRLYTSVIDEVALEMVERLKSLRDDNNMIPNINEEINLWALESVGVVALGSRLRCFDKSTDKNSSVNQLIDVVQNIVKLIDDIDIMKPEIWKYYPTKSYRQAMVFFKKQDILARHFIDQAIKEFQSHPKPDDQKGVLEKLLEINKEVAIVMASDMMLAGIESAVNSVLAALYLLATNPEKQFKLRAELKTYDKKRTYLKACVKEAIRMMPVVSGNLRETTKDYNILGYIVPKGVHVVFSHREMSRMDKYFVKPDEYIPERWIVDKDDPLYSRINHLFAYNPFGFGARSCVGRRIAELEMETFIERAIEHFEVNWFGPPPKIFQASFNYVMGPYNFVFKDVK